MGVVARCQRGLLEAKEAKLKNQAVRDSMTFLGTIRNSVQFQLIGRGGKSQEMALGQPPSEFGLHPRASGGLRHQISLPRDSCHGWLVPQLLMYKKDADSVKTSDSKTQSSCRQIQRQCFGYLSLVVKTGSWCPDIMKTLIAWNDWCILGLKACQKSHNISSLILAQWTYLSGSWKLPGKLWTKPWHPDAQATLSNSDWIVWGGGRHWHFFLTPKVIPCAVMGGNYRKVLSLATLPLEKYMDFPH